MTTPTAPLRLGTRASRLARWQAEWIAARLKELGAEVELVLITTEGDVRTGPLGQIGGQGLFTKGIQRALLAGQIDLAVHSLKDLPTAPVEGLVLAAVPQRHAAGDVLVSRNGRSLAELPAGTRVGTGSNRRKAQLLHLRGDLDVQQIRGNVETRLRKLDEGEFDAVVLAEAGLARLGLDGRIVQRFSPAELLPAAGQGALGLETRAGDDATRQVVSRLNDPASFQAVCAERAMLARLQAGCLAPVGAWARVEQNALRLDAAVLSLDGKTRIAASHCGPADEAIDIGCAVADQLIDQGAGELIRATRN